MLTVSERLRMPGTKSAGAVAAALFTTSAPGATSLNSLPKVLALHGFRTSDSILQQQITISGLRDFFKDRFNITYLSGPHAAGGAPAADVQKYFKPPYYEWWNVHMDESTGIKDYVGCAESLEFVATHMREHGPYVGLLGFSQGATMAGLISALQQKGLDFQGVPRLHFLLLISGSVNFDPQYRHLYEDKIQTPAVLIIGDQDVGRANHDMLADHVVAPLVLRHPRGHLVPRLSVDQLEQLDNFLIGRNFVPAMLKQGLGEPQQAI